jgi:hypothetical protein
MLDTAHHARKLLYGFAQITRVVLQKQKCGSTGRGCRLGPLDLAIVTPGILGSHWQVPSVVNLLMKVDLQAYLLSKDSVPMLISIRTSYEMLNSDSQNDGLDI